MSSIHKVAAKSLSEDYMTMSKTQQRGCLIGGGTRQNRLKGKVSASVNCGNIPYQTSSVSLPENPTSRLRDTAPAQMDYYSDFSEDDDRELVDLHNFSVSPLDFSNRNGAQGDSHRMGICFTSGDQCCFQPIKATPQDLKLEYPEVPRLRLDGANGDSSVSKRQSTPDALHCEKCEEYCFHGCKYCKEVRQMAGPPVTQVYPLWLEKPKPAKNEEKKKEDYNTPRDSETESENESAKDSDKEEEDAEVQKTFQQNRPRPQISPDDHKRRCGGQRRRGDNRNEVDNKGMEKQGNQRSSSDQSQEEMYWYEGRGTTNKNLYQFGKPKVKGEKREKIKVIVEDKSFKIHKDTLALHSRAIRREMIKAGPYMPSFITLRGMTKQNFGVVRDWMKGDDTGINERNVFEIRKIAEELEIRDLRRQCTEIMRAAAGDDPPEGALQVDKSKEKSKQPEDNNQGQEKEQPPEEKEPKEERGKSKAPGDKKSKGNKGLKKTGSLKPPPRDKIDGKVLRKSKSEMNEDEDREKDKTDQDQAAANEDQDEDAKNKDQEDNVNAEKEQPPASSVSSTTSPPESPENPNEKKKRFRDRILFWKRKEEPPPSPASSVAEEEVPPEQKHVHKHEPTTAAPIPATKHKHKHKPKPKEEPKHVRKVSEPESESEEESKPKEETSEYEYSYETEDNEPPPVRRPVLKSIPSYQKMSDQMTSDQISDIERVPQPELERRREPEPAPRKRTRLCRRRLYHGRQPIGSTVMWNVDPNCYIHRAMLADKKEEFNQRQMEEEAEFQATRREPRDTFLPVIKPKPKPVPCHVQKEPVPDEETPYHRTRPCTTEEAAVQATREEPEEVVCKKKPSGPKKEKKPCRPKCKGRELRSCPVEKCNELVSLLVGDSEVKVNRFVASKQSKVIYEMVRNKNVSAHAVTIRGVEEPILREVAGWMNGGSMCIYPNEIKKFMCVASTLDIPELCHKLRHYQICVDSGCREPLTVAPLEDCGDSFISSEIVESAVDSISGAARTLWDAGKCNVYIKERDRDADCREVKRRSRCRPCDRPVDENNKRECYESIISEKKTEERRVSDKQRRRRKEERTCQKEDPDRDVADDDGDKKRFCEVYKCSCRRAPPRETETPPMMSDYLCGREKCVRAKSRLVMLMNSLQSANAVVLGENFCGGNGPLGNEEDNPYIQYENVKFPFNSTKYHWVVEAPKPMCVAFCSSVLVGDNLIVSGGRMVRDTRPSSPEAVTCISSFNICTHRWTHSGFMRYARIHHAAVELNGDVYFIGGIDENLRMLASVENLNLCSGKCNEVAPLGLGRAGLAAAAFRGTLWVAGGLSEFPIGNKSSYVLDLVEYYDPSGNSWQSVQCLTIPRAFATMVPFEDVLYVVGGVTPITKLDNSNEAVEAVSAVEFISGPGCQWTSCGSLKQGRYCANAIIFEKSVYIFGGMCLKRGIRISLVELMPKSKVSWDNADEEFVGCLQEALK